MYPYIDGIRIGKEKKEKQVRKEQYDDISEREGEEEAGEAE